MQTAKKIICSLLVFGSSASSFADVSCNTPDKTFGPYVCVFDNTQSQASIQNTVTAIHNQQAYDEFSTRTKEGSYYALLFKPGNYSNVSVPVGFYTQVAGLGMTPQETILKNLTVTDLIGGHSTTMFWRSAENLTITDKAMWAVSQASPLRNMIFKNDLSLALGGQNTWASGGFLANSEVDGVIDPANQQQWMTRNTRFGGWITKGWNMVFVGDTNNVPRGNLPNTVVPNTPRIQEKPYLAFQQDYEVVVPPVTHDSQGPSWGKVDTIIPRNQFIIVFPGETADDINKKLADTSIPNPKALIFTPGQYDINKPINITTKNTVVLGLGVPVLTGVTNGSPIMVTSAPGIKISGLIFEAGAHDATTNDPSLLQINAAEGSDENTFTTLSDVYCRAGGRISAKTNSCVTINDDYVVGDNLWLWRADHGVAGVNPYAKKGLIINGNHVTMYGLAVEHFQDQQVYWSGENGSNYFYQSEFPYDAPGPVQASIIIDDHVNYFNGYGIGIYDHFISGGSALSAIKMPNHPSISLFHMDDVSLPHSNPTQHTIFTTDNKLWGPASVPPGGAYYPKWPE